MQDNTLIKEIESRLEKLKEHEKDKKDEQNKQNEFEILNHAVSYLLNKTLQDELESLLKFAHEN